MCGRSHSGVVGRLGDLHPTDLGWIGESELVAVSRLMGGTREGSAELSF